MSHNQILTLVNEDYGITSIVTKVSKGYAVTLIDTDAEDIVGSKLYPPEQLGEALAYAAKLCE
jgi:hypothetical protein